MSSYCETHARMKLPEDGCPVCLRAENARLREALEASTDLLDRVEKAFTEAWCIDWSEIPKQSAKNRAALEGKK